MTETPRMSSSPWAGATIYLVGTSGFPNYGDELITATWLRYLATAAPEADVWVDCASPGPATVLLGDLHPRVKFVDTLWRLCWEAPSDEPWEVASWVQHAVEFPGHAPRWVQAIEVLHRADVVHVIGGGYVNAIWPRHVGLVAGAAAAARRSGGRAVMTGQGLYPAAPQATSLLRKLVERFDVVDVRDDASAELLDAAGTENVRKTVDDAFMGLGTHLYSKEEELPEFMLCIQSDLIEVPRPALASLVLDTLRSWGATAGDIGFVEGIPRVDREVYGLIEHELPGVRFFPFSDIWRDGLPVRTGQKWLSTRFHLHMVAAAAGASGVAVSVRPDYYATKHRSLIDLGSSWSMTTDVTDVPEPPTAGGYAPELLAKYRETKLDLAGRIYVPPVRPEPEPPAEEVPAPVAEGDGGKPRGLRGMASLWGAFS
ncbi:polysaccharide pyruvyl transferase family protein [Saccharothrix xinjiangensis]|uniref:Polysaccharide pyruvyl transferase family protein n=1 Tax=Saccharothrix xinjiangensis TaxID=204798 RepID=A0ABV9XY79_9PSEU